MIRHPTKHSAIRQTRILIEFLLGLAVVLPVTGQPAHAYTDPGSGAVLWQLFFASIVSIGFQFRRLRTWFTKRWPRR